MRKIWLSLLLLAGIGVAAAITQDSNTAKAYAPPPASNYYILRGGMNLRITLPPLELYRPVELRIAGERFAFDPNTGQFRLTTAPSDLSVSTSRRIINGYSPKRDYYEVTIRGFVLGGGGLAKSIMNLHRSYSANASTPPPASTVCVILGCETAPYQPYEYKMTFAALTRSVAKDYGDWLRTFPSANDINNIYLSDRSCAAVNATSGTTLCTKTVARLAVPGFSPTSHFLTHAIPVFGGISVEGNVAGTGNIRGFVFDENSPKAIAVGGTVDAGVTGGAGNNPQNYAQNATQINWGNENTTGTVGNKIKTLFDNASSKAAVVSNNPTFINGSIYLNSRSTSLRNTSTTTLSSPPEGKLWVINGNTTLTNVIIYGNGTIMVNGNLVINQRLLCAPGARFGIIATGTITMDLSTVDGEVGCGAYVARGGDMIFGDALNDPDVIYQAKGIFIARGSIQLPSIADDVVFKVKYDNTFAADPTVLFKELLSIVFSTVS